MSNENNRFFYCGNKCTHEVHFRMADKDVAFKIRVEEELRKEFIEICRAEDMTAAQVVRQFMRQYIKQHQASALQGNLFNSAKRK